MDWSSIFVHITFLSTAIIARFTFEGLVSNLNWRNVFLHIKFVRNFLVQTLNLNRVFSSCTGLIFDLICNHKIAMCLSRLQFWEKNGYKIHIWIASFLHGLQQYVLSGFYFQKTLVAKFTLELFFTSWSAAVWYFRLFFWENLWSQILHLSCFSPSCTEVTWWISLIF